MTQKAIFLPQGKYLLSLRYQLEGDSPHLLSIHSTLNISQLMLTFYKSSTDSQFLICSYEIQNVPENECCTTPLAAEPN